MPGIRFGGGAATTPSSSSADRRKRGSRVKRGLEALVNLDAKQAQTHPKRARTEASVAADNDDVALTAGHGPQSVPALTHVDGEPHTVFEEDWSDWLAVKTALFPSIREAKAGTTGATTPSRADEDHALSVIRMWAARHRVDGAALPAYIEATLLVKDAQRLDAAAVAAVQDENSVSVSSCRSSELSRTAAVVRAAYAHAVNRTVHLMTGALIKSRSFVNEASTYRDRAKQVGFPEEAVEVRQRIAHGSEPTLSELRWVASLVLQHLHDTFWLSQAAHVAALQDEVKRTKQKHQSVTVKASLRKPKKMSLTDLESLLHDADEAIEQQAAVADDNNTNQFNVGRYCVVAAVL